MTGRAYKAVHRSVGSGIKRYRATHAKHKDVRCKKCDRKAYRVYARGRHTRKGGNAYFSPIGYWCVCSKRKVLNARDVKRASPRT